MVKKEGKKEKKKIKLAVKRSKWEKQEDLGHMQEKSTPPPTLLFTRNK